MLHVQCTCVAKESSVQMIMLTFNQSIQAINCGVLCCKTLHYFFSLSSQLENLEVSVDFYMNISCQNVQ